MELLIVTSSKETVNTSNTHFTILINQRFNSNNLLQLKYTDMKKIKGSKNSNSMLDQKTGSMLDVKTNEDFNNEHPDHDDAGLIKGNSGGDDKKPASKLKLKKK